MDDQSFFIVVAILCGAISFVAGWISGHHAGEDDRLGPLIALAIGAGARSVTIIFKFNEDGEVACDIETDPPMISQSDIDAMMT